MVALISPADEICQVENASWLTDRTDCRHWRAPILPLAQNGEKQLIRGGFKQVVYLFLI